MTPLEFVTRSEIETVDAGRALAGIVAAGDVIVLAGDLGAGKTVLARGLAAGLGVTGPVTSPTFNLLVVHSGEPVLNHFDLYRLDREAQLEDIDFWGVLESCGVSVIEWGDRFPDALPSDGRVDVSITTLPDGSRRFELSGIGPRGRQIALAWLGSLDEAHS